MLGCYDIGLSMWFHLTARRQGDSGDGFGQLMQGQMVGEQQEQEERIENW